MSYLKILSEIWKSGAEMKLSESGEIELLHSELVPVEIMSAAEQVFDEIEKWFMSWKSATATQITMRNIYLQYCGWTNNAKIAHWLDYEEAKTFRVHDWMLVLTKNGWTSTYEDYRDFENEESNVIAEEIFKNACEYMRNLEGTT